jgi:hypothetical protein
MPATTEGEAMRIIVKQSFALCMSAALFTSASFAQTASPYAGQQARAVKSLSPQDIDGLRAGAGAGYAKAAELNGYPGPAHVLELGAQLQLDAEQQEATKALMSGHKGRATTLGAELIDAETALDRLFVEKTADPASVDRATARVGELQARLRAEHLKTHLAQTALLTPEQVHRYAALRGYEGSPAQAGDAHGLHQH